MSSAGLKRAFDATGYAVETPAGRMQIQPGQRVRMDGFRLAGGRTLVVLTAWNPRGRRRADRVNRIAQRRLEALLRRRGFDWWPSVNAPGHPVWQEPGCAVPTRHPAVVAEIARRFRQAAVLVLAPGLPARVVMLTLPSPRAAPARPA